MNTTQSSDSWRWLGLFILLAILLILWLMGLGPSFSGDQAGCCGVPTATAPVPAPIPQQAPPPTVTAPEPAKPEAVKLGLQLENGKAILTGIVPTEADHQKLVAVATEIYGEGNVIDKLTVSANASLPAWWPNLATTINTLKGISHYGLRQNGEVVSLSGEVTNEADKATKEAALQALLGNKVTINNLLTLVAKTETVIAPVESKTPTIVCSADMNVAIKFANNSAHLSEAGKKQLDEIAKCLTQPTEVAGHTDNYGENSYNLTLSKRRANAVIDYIKTIDPAKAAILTATGYGETKPIASNTTRASRALNRRIEFVAK